MENNIFEGAKFGDKFITKDSRVCSYVGIYQECVKYPYFTKHLVIFENEICTEVYTEKGVGQHKFSGDNSDIVSRYQESIDEKKLDELARTEYQTKTWLEFPTDDRVRYYKAGYRKAMEE